MTQRFGKWLKYLGNGIAVWGTAKEFEKMHKCVGNDLNILNMAQICGKRLQLYQKWLYSVGNDLRI